VQPSRNWQSYRHKTASKRHETPITGGKMNRGVDCGVSETTSTYSWQALFLDDCGRAQHGPSKPLRLANLGRTRCDKAARGLTEGQNDGKAINCSRGSASLVPRSLMAGCCRLPGPIHTPRLAVEDKYRGFISRCGLIPCSVPPRALTTS